MKKLVILIVLLLLVVGGGYFYLKVVKTGLFDQAVSLYTPPRKDIKQFLPQGEDLSYPLRLPKGYRIGVFADLKGQRPRVLAFDPNGVLVTSLTRSGRVVALPDDNNDGTADEVVEIASGLDRPHGLVFYSNSLFIAETDRVVRYTYDPSTLSISGGTELFSLPGGGRHFTRTIKINNDKLYTAVGSSCDTCIESDEKRAAILVSDLDGSNLEVFSWGLRNTVFFTFDEKDRMWGNDMGRDFLGDNLPPDELNIIEEGGDYGWPYCYGNKVRDERFMEGEEQNYCLDTKVPIFNYQAHVAPLGIAFIDSDLFPSTDQGNILVALHGSWNRSVPVGYKIVKLSLFGGSVTGSEDFISGFLQGGETLGRPVDLVFDNQGYLYISDDHAGLIYVVSRN